MLEFRLRADLGTNDLHVDKPAFVPGAEPIEECDPLVTWNLTRCHLNSLAVMPPTYRLDTFPALHLFATVPCAPVARRHGFRRCESQRRTDRAAGRGNSGSAVLFPVGR